jgi:PilZ domain-containing protein
MIPAEIIFGGGQAMQECIIRDLSDGGAKLEFANVKTVPSSFDLIVKGHRPHHCRVAWRALRELGVQFMTVPA